MTFFRDLKLSNDPIIHKQFDEFYRTKLKATIIKRFHKDREAQFTYHTDVVVTLKDGTRYSIDEKIRREKYKENPHYPIETWSNYPIKRGCFFTSLANMFVFGTLDNDNTRKVAYYLPILLNPAVKNYIKNLDKPQYRPHCRQLNDTRNKWVHYTEFKRFGSILDGEQLTLRDTR